MLTLKQMQILKSDQRVKLFNADNLVMESVGEGKEGNKERTEGRRENGKVEGRMGGSK